MEALSSWAKGMMGSARRRYKLGKWDTLYGYGESTYGVPTVDYAPIRVNIPIPIAFPAGILWLVKGIAYVKEVSVLAA